MTIRAITLGLFGVVAAGLLAELFMGFPLSRVSRSWTTWLFGIVVVGALYLVGDLAAGWIGDRDKVTDPLSKRVWHLTLLIGSAVLFYALLAAVVWLAR